VKITTLGSWGAYPAAGSATSGYLLQADGRNILIDCGSGVLAQLQNHIALEELDAVVLSHYHTDHIADVFCLQYAVMILTQLGKRTKPLPIYAHTEDSAMFAQLTYGAYCEAQPISAGETLRLGAITFAFASNVHPVPCLAMRIEHVGRTIVYTADTGWNDALVPFCRDADLLVAECSFYNEQLGTIPGHLTAGEAGMLAAQSGAKRLVLTHLPQYGDHRQLLAEAGESYAGDVSLTYSGDVFTV